MITKLADWVRTHEKLFLALLVIVFLLIRLPGLSQPLHQDEYKWPLATDPTLAVPGGPTIPHPPLGELIYRTAGYIVGFNVHFRMVPLFFGALNLILLYYVLKGRFGKKVATVGSVFFILSYFSILASLMVDTDGAIMPFFFLLMLLSYDRWRAPGSKKKMWLSLAVLFAILGLFIKVSFVLAIGAVIADFLWEKRHIINTKDLLRYASIALGFIIGFIILLVLSQKVFPFFDLKASVVYWEHFIDIHRDWFQTCIQLIKAILYMSPFFILLPLLVPRDKWKQLVPFTALLLFGFIFYIILFDFSLGALDRYLQFIIVPLCAITAVTVVEILQRYKQDKNKNILMVIYGAIIACLLALVSFIPQYVSSLYPKSAWVSRALSFKWNFLYPFSGGSGPLGFYISFLFLALAWIVSIVLINIAYFKPHLRKNILLILIPIGLMYNMMFAEEYMFGLINGSASRLLGPAVQFIQNDPEIQKVVVYNDNGGWDIQQTGKYDKRLYTSPEFNLVDKITGLNTHKDFYFELNIPRIDPNSVYRKYLDSCPIVYDQTDKYISAIVYDCRNAPEIIQQ